MDESTKRRNKVLNRTKSFPEEIVVEDDVDAATICLPVNAVRNAAVCVEKTRLLGRWFSSIS